METWRKLTPALVLLTITGCGSNSAGPPTDPDLLKAKISKLVTDGNFAEALVPSRASVDAAEAKYGKDSLELADCLVALGQIQAGLKNPSEAVLAFDRATAIHIKAGVTGPRLAIPIIFSAGNLIDLGKHELAEERYISAIKILNDSGDENSFVLVSTAVDLAGLKITRGKGEEAEDFLQMALKACRNESEAPPNIYSRVLNNIGEIRYLRGDYDDALNYYHQALDLALAKMPGEEQMIGVFRKNVENAKAKLKSDK